jgi:hypothetical protein
MHGTGLNMVLVVQLVVDEVFEELATLKEIEMLTHRILHCKTTPPRFLDPPRLRGQGTAMTAMTS